MTLEKLFWTIHERIMSMCADAELNVSTWFRTKTYLICNDDWPQIDKVFTSNECSIINGHDLKIMHDENYGNELNTTNYFIAGS